MEYKYSNDGNFEDLACGRVIYHRPGMTNFPVRLAQEIFGRCLSYLKEKERVTVYDPCCGGGYLLTVLGLLNMDSIKYIMGSDVSEEAVALCAKNLSLLTEEGMENRISQLKDMHKEYGKASHLSAIESAERLMGTVKKNSEKPEVHIFQCNILEDGLLNLKIPKADIIITDVPYGSLVSWQGTEQDFINKMLDNLVPVIKPDSVIAICSDKKQKVKHERYKRLEKQLIGKRKFEILMLEEIELCR